MGISHVQRAGYIIPRIQRPRWRNKYFLTFDSRRDLWQTARKKVNYARIVVDYQPQKADPNCVLLTVGDNTLNVPGDLSTTTADPTTSKILWNSVLSKKYARFAYIDIKICISKLEWRITNICGYQNSLMNMVWKAKFTKGFYIVRYEKEFMDCPKLVKPQTHF